MARSLKVRSDQIGTVKLSVRRNGFLTQRALAEDCGVALSTVSNFLTGKPVDRAVFEELCDHLSLTWQDVADLEADSLPASIQATPCLDWGEAPDVSLFCGREAELATLEQWIATERCRLVSIVGLGGVGKTALSVKLSEHLLSQFEVLIWRSLRNVPPVQMLLTELILMLSRQQTLNVPESLAEKLSQLIEYLRQNRCLLVLDNVEAILQSGEQVGQYREGYEDYDELFCSVADRRHQSCLVLTSREKIRSLDARDDLSPIHALQLSGLSLTEGQQILQAKGLVDSENAFGRIITDYAGNPLALKIAAATIRSTFAGNIDQFLQQSTVAYGGVWELLEQHFMRLSPLEQQVMYWLMIEREWVSFTNLQTNWIPTLGQRELIESLESLQGRSLIETSAMGFTQQPVVMEYVTQKFIDGCYQNLTTQTLNLFRSHALLKAQTKDYIRDTQRRLILQPLAQKLLVTLNGQDATEFVLNQLLAMLRGKPLSYTGYAAGNIINLLSNFRADLNDRDFSELAIAQADLTKVTLHRTSFADSTFYRSSFAESFGGIIAVAFSPDQQHLAISDACCEIHLWQLDESKKLMTFRGHNSWISSLVFSPSGRTLASASDDYVVKLWDLSTGVCLQTLKGPAILNHAVMFSPNEQTFLYNDTSAIQFWDVEHPEHQVAVLKGYPDLVRTVAFSPDGQTIANSTQDQTIKLWNLRTGDCLQTLQGHTGLVRYVTFSPNGQRLASTSLDQTVQVWDVQSGQCLHILQGHQQGISEIAFSPDGQTLASSSFDQTVKLWDVLTGECLRTLYGHQKQLRAVAFSPDGQCLVSGGDDHAVKVWDLETGQCIKTIQGYVNAVTAIACQANPRILASAHGDQTIQVWDLATEQVLKFLPAHTDLIWSIAFAPNNEAILASASADRTAKLWNWQTGACLKRFTHQNWVWSVDFHPSGQFLATGSYDQTIKLWSLETGDCLRTLLGHTNAVLFVAFSPDGQRLASSSYDQTIRLWNFESGECDRILLGHRDRVWQVAFSPDGQRIASCSYDHTIKLWNAQTGECLSTLIEHQGAVTSVCFSSKGQYLMSGSLDHTIKVWDISTGRCLKTLRGHDAGILSIRVQLLAQADLAEVEPVTCPEILISSSLDGTIRVWQLETGRYLKSLRIPRPYEDMNIRPVVK